MKLLQYVPPIYSNFYDGKNVSGLFINVFFTYEWKSFLKTSVRKRAGTVFAVKCFT